MKRSGTGCLVFALTAIVCGASTDALANGARVSGRVVDTDDAGQSDHAVVFVNVPPDRNPGANVRTDGKGRFSIADLAPGTYRVESGSLAARIRHVTLELRSPDGARIGNFEEEIPPGLLPSPFRIGMLQRAIIRLTIEPNETHAPIATATVEAALASSAALSELNRIFLAGDMAQLLVRSEEAIAREPGLGGAWYLRSIALWRTGKLEEAVSTMRQALELVPDQPGGAGALGSILLDLAEMQAAQQPEASRRSLEEAARLLDTACVEQASDNRTFLTNRVVAHQRRGDATGEIGALRALLATSPNDDKAWLRLAELLALGREIDPALEALRRMSVQGSDAVLVIYNAAVSLYNDGRLDDVGMLVRGLVTMKPDLPDLHRMLGRVLIAQGDQAGALHHMKEYLRLAGDTPDATAEQALVEALEKNRP